ncbi:hypothetical protein M422DRAFT_270494 [Sphaerobolus stellatus SS14]|uniref:Uncharacterized protein n=1 Tax=Sphaerobolus stellatus (strain SS14) TaxID=990650 RepID=A0A0C9U292_SPHS4|nr:hypothetical protein M422DRAFT_270494 [Sphaerobolus stellatus SS14]
MSPTSNSMVGGGSTAVTPTAISSLSQNDVTTHMQISMTNAMVKSVDSIFSIVDSFKADQPLRQSHPYPAPFNRKKWFNSPYFYPHIYKKGPKNFKPRGEKRGKGGNSGSPPSAPFGSTSKTTNTDQGSLANIATQAPPPSTIPPPLPPSLPSPVSTAMMITNSPLPSPPQSEFSTPILGLQKLQNGDNGGVTTAMGALHITPPSTGIQFAPKFEFDDGYR